MNGQGDPADDTGLPAGILPARYRVIRQLGHGGMATVFLCEDSDSGGLVAAKILRREYASALTIERFVREIDFISKLNHRFIPKIMATGVTGERPFYVMTYVAGDSLRKILEVEDRLPVEEVVRVTRGILEPLGFAHEHGIVHRDIKPDNIVLGPDGIYVLDFGIARAISDAGGQRLTRTGLVVGTPAYMSPEQAVGERALDHRSDIFSLGCVMYEMLAGVQPFTGDTPQALIARRFASRPRPLKAFRDDVSEAISSAVARAMSISPADRWTSAKEFMSALDAASSPIIAKTASYPSNSSDADGHDGLLERLRAQFADQFRVDEEMKGGGMSRLFLATDLELKRKVVIKILPPDLTSPMMLARFKRESEVTARLQHPHILPVISAGVREGLAYYVMPFFEGESLRARMKREGKLPVNATIRILCEITDALSCAHENGVIHRDIKPENILILGGHAVVADFGIAGALSAATGESSYRITGTGMSLGTVGYMAPEQALGERSVDGRADIYSVGVIAYEMLAGVQPFTGETDQAVLMGHLTREPKPVETLRSDTPPALSAAIHKALQKDPSRRYDTALEFHEIMEDLRPVTPHALSGEAGAQRAITSAPPAPADRKGRVTLYKWWKVAVPLVLVMAIALGAQYVRSRPRVSAVANRNVAILYFEDLSPRRELGHLTDAFTDDLIDRLQEVRALNVVSKNGVQQVRQMKLELDSAAKLLKAGTLVTGSVEPIGDRLRVRVAVTDGSTGQELDRASLEYPSADPLSLREKLVGDVADLLRQRLGAEVLISERKSGTDDPQSWLLVERGERLIKEADALASAGDTSAASRRLLAADSIVARAALRDQRWIEPVVMRGSISFKRSRIASEPPEMSEWANKGLGFAESALKHDSRNAAALELRGTLRYWKWLNDLVTDPAEAAETLKLAEQDLRAAVRAAPQRASAWSVLSSLFANKADPIEAAIAARRAYEEDAYLSAAPDILWRLYSTAYDNQQAVPAEHWCNEGAQRFPSNPRFVQCRLWMLTMPGRKTKPDSAWRLIEQLRKVTSDKDWEFSGREARMLVASGLARAGLMDSARRVLVSARGDATIDPTRDLLIDEALVRVILGDKDEALRLLKLYLLANPEHRAGMAETQSWWWRDLQGDPRYREMVGTAD